MSKPNKSDTQPSQPEGFGEAPQSGFDADMRVSSDIAQKILDAPATDQPKSRARRPVERSKGPAEKPSRAKGNSSGKAPGRSASKANAPAPAPFIDGTEGVDLKGGSSEAASHPRGITGAAETTHTLEALIKRGRPFYLPDDQPQWVPHRPERPEKLEGGIPFNLTSEYEPKGDQPTAIAELVDRHQRTRRRPGAARRHRLGQDLHHGAGHPAHQRPAVILAQQDARRPALWRVQNPSSPTMRWSISSPTTTTTSPRPMCRAPTPSSRRKAPSTSRSTACATRPRALLERDDVIIVASVSCIYGIGSVETYTAMTFELEVGERINQRKLAGRSGGLQYKRNDGASPVATFRVRGDTVEIFPAHYEDRAWRISLFGDEIERSPSSIR
jgi:excinuclease ABC subunit B